MEYDRDATVVFGDPAWMATVPEATARTAEHWSTRLDRSVTGKRIRGSNFVVVNFEGTVAAGETRKFAFESDP